LEFLGWSTSSDISKSKICFEKVALNLNEPYLCKKNIQLEEPIESVLDLWCNLNNISAEFSDDSMTVKGVLIGSIIASNENSESFYTEKNVEFETKYSLQNKLNNAYCEPEISIISCSYTLISPDSIELRIELSVNATIYEKNDIALICDFNVDENAPAEKQCKGAMIIYFPDNEEKVWDIARKYGASVDEIMRINELDCDTVNEGKMILVPMI